MRSLRVLSSLIVLLSGCAPRRERLPAVQWAGDAAALHELAARAAAVRTASAQCELTLTRPNGESVRLDGALAMRPPSEVRLRAWKLGQAVFDLTLNPDGLWIEMPPDRNRRERVLPAGTNAGRMTRAWALLSGEFFTAGDPRVLDSGGTRFHVERTIDGQRVTCEVDRATLTPRLYTLRDPSGVVRMTLAEDRYRMINGIAWPTRLVAKSESGTIVVEMSDVELNGELPPGAFVPPHRAERVP